MAAAGTVAVLLPGAFYFLRETQAAAGRRSSAGTACRMARRHRLQSRHLAADLAAAGHEHGRDAVPPDRRGVPGRRHARGGARAGPARRDRHARGRQVRATSRSGTSSARPSCVYRMGFNPLHARVWRGRNEREPSSSRPASVPLAAWRAIYRGAAARARSGARGPRSRPAPRRWRAIVARGEPVYGINTGFGKLASVRIAAGRPRARSSATSCSRTPPASASRCRSPVVRLMMALKLASLAQGASGVRSATLDAARGAARRAASLPVVPAQGLGRRLGRPRAAGPHGGGADRRRRRASPTASRVPAAAGARRRPASRRSCSAPKEGLALLNGTQVSTAYALAGAVRGRARCSRRRWSPARSSTDAARGSDAPFDPRIHALRRHAARSRPPTRCAA